VPDLPPHDLPRLATARPEAALRQDVLAAALDGLTASRKTLPPALFYDEAGCHLFEQITRLPEYYPTRTEMALLPRVAVDVAAATSPGAALVEYGAGSEDKAAILLAALRAPSAWVPVDVAAPALDRAAARLRARFPGLAVLPVAADFLRPLVLPPSLAGRPVRGFFPGSTIGNLDPEQAVAFLRTAAATLGSGARFLVGVDLPKDPDILVPAYDDAQGVTAAFNRNLLYRLNREAGADFDPEAFAHHALWNPAESRIEMHLVSRRSQAVRLNGTAIRFAPGETIHTENSYKHSPAAFRALARAGGWRPERCWSDPAMLFSVHLLAA
jgi:dimethylhistidine N-methyltransferase